MRYFASKKLIMAVGVLVFVGLVGLLANDVLAQQLNLPGIPGPTVPGAPAAGGTPPNLRGFGTGIFTEVSKTVVTVYGVLWALQGILNSLLTFTGFVLDNVFLWAISLNPGTMPIVATGWGVIRDISNSIFILIVLWIAFAIIFNLDERLGGKRLLVRVIIMALLINFSLAMVSLVFGFTNALARPFRNAIANNSSAEATGFRNVSDIIMSNTKIYAALNKSTQKDLDVLKNYAARQEEERIRNIPVDIGGGFQTYLGAPQEAKAIAPVALAGCVFGALTGIPIPGIGTVCAASALAVQWATSLTSLGIAVGVTASLYHSIIEMAVGSFFVIITIFALLTASIVLIARIVAMTFLSILAPAAFLLYAMPNKYGEKYWNMWVENVLKWAFFAPAFYFLFYISLLILQEMNAKKPVLGSFIPDLPQQLILIVFLAFLFGTIGLARKMGITVADSFINWGKKAGWGALGLAGGLAKGGAARLAGRALKPEGAVQKGLTRIAEAPGLRWVGGAFPQRAAAQFLQTQRARVDAEKKKLEIFSKPQLLADYRATFTPERKTAIMEQIIEKGWLKDFEKENPDQLKPALDLAARYGKQQPILKARPDLLTETNYHYVPGAKNLREALDQIMKSPDMDKVKISPESYGKPEVLRAILLNIKGPKELQRIDRENSFLYQQLEQYYNENKTTLQGDFAALGEDRGKALSNTIETYLVGRLARIMREQRGGTPPAGAPPAGAPPAGAPPAGAPPVTPPAGAQRPRTPPINTLQAGTPQTGTRQPGTPFINTPHSGAPTRGTSSDLSEEIAQEQQEQQDEQELILEQDEEEEAEGGAPGEGAPPPAPPGPPPAV